MLLKEMYLIDWSRLKKTNFKSLYCAEYLYQVSIILSVSLFRYIPTDWLETLDNLEPKGKAEINKINMELVHQLKANDSAFSLGRTSDGLACARFGLISQDTDMEELLGLVYATGKEIEESSRVSLLSI